jgi:hypothetical protein
MLTPSPPRSASGSMSNGIGTGITPLKCHKLRMDPSSGGRHFVRDTLAAMVYYSALTCC